LAIELVLLAAEEEELLAFDVEAAGPIDPNPKN
jgi:hypothetical protein